MVIDEPNNIPEEPTDPATVDPRQDRMILALLGHPTMERVAAAFGISAVRL